MALKSSILFGVLILFLLENVSAQNINGFEINISQNTGITLYFNSEITNYHFSEKNDIYRVIFVDVKTIMIQTSQKVDQPYKLFVEEGGRKHTFILVYKDHVDLPDQDHDYSDLKELDKLVKEFNKTHQPDQSNTSTQVNGTNNQASNEKQPQVNKNNTQPANDSSNVDNSFYSLLGAADKAKNAQQFDDAKSKYLQALQLKPDNQYAQNGLAEVNRLIEAQSGLKYADIMTKANNAFTDARYDEALQYYNDALTIKPGEAYPASQITLIKKKQEAAKAEEANRQKDSAFNSYLFTGDKAVNDKSYDGALIAYNEALKINPDNPIAKSKISSLKQKIYSDSIEAENKAKDNLYQSFMSNGDKAIKEKSYQEARMAYNEALKIKPEDVLATSKLNAINQQLAADSIQAENTKIIALRDDYIKSGDKAFIDNLFDEAKNNYNEALKIKPDDNYAKTQLRKIDDALDKIKLQTQKDLEVQHNNELEKQYNDLIAAADNYYNAGMYAEALSQYQQALQVNKNDQYSKNKISQINSLVRQQKEKQIQDSINTTKYTTLILKADEAFDKNDFANAKLSYTNALKYKGDDAYAKDKLAQIQIVQQQAVTQNQAIKDSIAKENETVKQYNLLITKARAAYNKNDFVMARGFYASATALKPNEDEAKNKMMQIDDTLNVIVLQKQQKDISDSLSTAGDAALIDSDYTAAINNYQQALALNQSADTYYLNKQINFAKSQIAIKDSFNSNTKQTQKLKDAMDIYKLGTNAIKYQYWDSALFYLRQFMSIADSANPSSDEYAIYDIDSKVNYSKTKITAIENYLKKPKDTVIHKLPDVKTLPSRIIIIYYNPKNPQLETIYKKYPDIGFNLAPGNQQFDTIDLSQENKLKSKDIMSAVPGMLAESTNNGITLTCENIIFRGSKAYFKFMLQNSNAEEFLTGSMLLTRKQDSGNTEKMLPVYISDYPIILTNQKPVIVYITKYKKIDDSDSLDFEVTDRLNKFKIRVTIPGSVYNKGQQVMK